jgi:uncharacterized protein YjbI with pentapeptide repeats
LDITDGSRLSGDNQRKSEGVQILNREHVGLINRGVNAWNRWRRSNRNIFPDLSGADLSGTNLRRALLGMVNLSEANLSGANLSEANLNFFANLSRANLIGAKFIRANLMMANLEMANLNEADFHGANLTEAKLSGANLSKATLSEANLRSANLSTADLSDASLREADLRWADLSGANLSEANLSRANLSAANLNKANLSGADLTNANLVETNVENANLNGCRIYGVSAWNIRVNQETRQSDLIITRLGEAVVKIDDIQVAQFIHLLLKYENVRNVLNSVTKRGVLILGRFGGGGLEVLRALGEALRHSGYLPMIFEFARPEDRTYTETIRTLAGLARFIVADLSGPSVPQELYATVPHLKIPLIPILEKGMQSYAMFVDLLEYDWVLDPIVEFDSTQALIKDLQDKIISPAEKRIETRQAKLKELFS